MPRLPLYQYGNGLLAYTWRSLPELFNKVDAYVNKEAKQGKPKEETEEYPHYGEIVEHFVKLSH